MSMWSEKAPFIYIFKKMNRKEFILNEEFTTHHQFVKYYNLF